MFEFNQYIIKFGTKFKSHNSTSISNNDFGANSETQYLMLQYVW